MLTESGNIIISKKPVTETEDYVWLRNTGLNYVQQFSGKIWTDYNIHDPGVTIFELLCYALTDLAYRTSLPVPDLLTAPGKQSPDATDFFTAKDILTTHPVTINDYRKLIIDRIPCVRNVWFDTLDNTNYEPAIFFDQKTVDISLTEPPSGHAYITLQLKGLYIVKIEVHDYDVIQEQHPDLLAVLINYRDANSPHTEPIVQEDEYKECIKNNVTEVLADNRNLCEDFEIIQTAGEELVAVCADIELKADANADTIFLAINNALYNYINPGLNVYSFKDLIDRGKRTEDIFNSALASRGFIDDDELNKHGHKEVLYVSDIINLLMDIPGILQIKKINISSYTKNSDGTYTVLQNAKQYCLNLQDTTNSVFQFLLDVAEQDKTQVFNRIRFSKGPIYFTPKRDADYKNYIVGYPSQPADFNNDLPIPSGKNRNLLNYYSVQNDFPLFYYTGMDGIPKGETALRKAQRLHSKAYLLFFDQLLADYLAQLNNLKNIFSIKGGNSAPVMPPLPLTQSMIKDLRMLLASKYPINTNNSDADFFQDSYTTYAALIETPEKQKERRNRLLDHLLARFNELFVDYSVFKFQQNTTGDFFSEIPDDELIDNKIQFLTVYPFISGNRSHAFNYTKDVYATDNISGLQLRVQKMLGLTSSQNKTLVSPINNIDYKILLNNIATNQPQQPDNKLQVTDNRFDSFDDNFGIHILEHILLRPLYKSTNPLDPLLSLCGDGSGNQEAACLLPDDYSMQLTVVAPGWLSISNNMDFRAFTENLIRAEAPAHTGIKICWLDPALMFLFEKTTETFFNAMTKIKKRGAQPSDQDFTDFNNALTDVYTIMKLMKNMYMPSTLDECENIKYDEDIDKIKVPVILNYSALGNTDEDEWYVFNKPQLKVKPEVAETKNTVTQPAEKASVKQTAPPKKTKQQKDK